MDLDAAAAAKALTGREALTHAPIDSQGPKAVGTFITFDVPGAGTTGTLPSGMNAEGVITGTYYDVNAVGHGFLRSRNGIFTKFDVPGLTSTFPASISEAGAITGTYAYTSDVNSVGHGFLRFRNGTFATFDAPGAALIGTIPSGINAEGAITGTYYDLNFVGHGFLRTTNGTLTPFDAPGAGTTGPTPGTYAVAINPEGVILGIYFDANNGSHGFLRARDGTFTTFDPPGSIAVFAPDSFGPDLYMNPEGVITGTYFEPISGNPFGGNFRVFVRTREGAFTTFDAATYAPCCIWSFPSGITPAEAITGSFNDGSSINHGFLRARDGTVTTFDVPGAGTGFNQGTAPLGITPAGVIMGKYIDTKNVNHGFLLLPLPCRQ